MNLASLTYVVFLLGCVFVHWLLPQTWRRGALLLASVGFYLWAMPRQLPVMLLYLWCVYVLGVMMARHRKKGAHALMIAGVALSMGYLVFYKYLGRALSPFTGGRDALGLTVPMGISYITFQGIAYLVMVYRRETRALANPAPLFLYALFFPKVTAGPIEPPDGFFRQMQQKPRLTWRGVLSASALIGVGFAKKCAAADLVAPAVNAVFSAPGQADGLTTLAGIVLYAAQIYFDFSGYTDIALGSARLFGLRLTENFDHPYAADSVVDFWRRWHISLTNWLRTYIYFPLGGSRVSRGRRYLNVLATFLVSGVWHGANLTFAVWGLWHGLWQVLELHFAPKSPRKGKPAPKSRGRRLLGRARTLAVVALGWVFFRADSLESVFRVLGGLFGRWALPGEALSALGLSAGAWALFLVTALGADRVKAYAASDRMTQRGGVALCVLAAAMALLGTVLGAASGAQSSFIYFNF